MLLGAQLTNIKIFAPFQWNFWRKAYKLQRGMLGRRLFLGLFIFNVMPVFIFGVQLYYWNYVKIESNLDCYSKIIVYSAVAFFLFRLLCRTAYIIGYFRGAISIRIITQEIQYRLKNGVYYILGMNTKALLITACWMHLLLRNSSQCCPILCYLLRLTLLYTA